MTVYEGANRVTSKFGMRTLNGRTAMHNGMDIAKGKGSKQRACVYGTVAWTSTGYSYGRGKNLVIRQDTSRGTIWVRHQHADTLLVRRGDTVIPTTYVATEGASGDVTGSHEHFEVVVGGSLNSASGEIIGGKAVDPSPWLGTPNAEGTYPQNDLVYNYGSGSYTPDKPNTDKGDDMAKLKIFTAQNKTPSSQLMKEGWILTGDGKFYNPAGDARYVREFDTGISKTYEDAKKELQPGEIMMVTED